MFFIRLATARYARASPESAAATLWIPLMCFPLKKTRIGDPGSIVRTHRGYSWVSLGALPRTPCGGHRRTLESWGGARIQSPDGLNNFWRCGK